MEELVICFAILIGVVGCTVDNHSDRVHEHKMEELAAKCGQPIVVKKDE